MKKQVYNPFLPSWEYIPDGEPHVFENRLYLFGSHDRFNGSQFCLNDYVCWWAPVEDLSDWHYEGVMYKKIQDPDAKQDSIMQAPDVIQGSDGRYYLYYALGLHPFISVAVSKRPEGPYEYYGKICYPDKTPVGCRDHDVFQFDPGLLRDDNGKIFLYSGFGPGSRGVFKNACKNFQMEGAYVTELETDMLTVKYAPRLLIPKEENAKGTCFEGHGFFEASSIRKHEGKYYFIYSSVNQHDLCYAISGYPDRDFCFGGRLVSNGDIGVDGNTEPKNYMGNNHGSLVLLNDQWYVFYHRQTNRHQFSRQACADRINFYHGRFQQAEMTSCGLNDGALRGEGEYPAYIAANLRSMDGAITYGRSDTPEADLHPFFTQSGEDRQGAPDQYIANMRDGSSATFKYFEMTNLGTMALLLGGSGKGSFEIQFGEKEKIEIPVDKASNGRLEWFFYPQNHIISIDDEKCPITFTWHGSGSLSFHNFRMQRA